MEDLGEFSRAYIEIPTNKPSSSVTTSPDPSPAPLYSSMTPSTKKRPTNCLQQTPKLMTKLFHHTQTFLCDDFKVVTSLLVFSLRFVVHIVNKRSSDPCEPLISCIIPFIPPNKSQNHLIIYRPSWPHGLLFQPVYQTLQRGFPKGSPWEIALTASSDDRWIVFYL